MLVFTFKIYLVDLIQIFLVYFLVVVIIIVIVFAKPSF